MKKIETQEPFKIGDETILAGNTKTVHLPVAMIPHHSGFDLTLRVIHGRRPGKCFFICSTIHGDELNGIEIIRRVLRSPFVKHLKGTLIAVPIVNLFGLLIQSRYLPDRRDLNRNFPGSDTGSAAAQLANVFLNEVVKRCSHGIDLHTGSSNRTNLPHIRCDLQMKEALNLALAFGAPVILKAPNRDGSLREASQDLGIATLTFEGGEALRFNEFAIRAAVQGILRVMTVLEMIPSGKCIAVKEKPVIATHSHWIRAPRTGIFHSTCLLGKKVFKGDLIGKVTDSLGTFSVDVKTPLDGIVIGRTQLPLVFKGDALFNIAWVPDPTKAEQSIEEFEEDVEFNPALDDPSTY